jgi:GNAT superfamily N-acetyltransferase
MPWVVREAVRDVNRAVGRRWRTIDPLLPDPVTLPAGCGEPLVVYGEPGPACNGSSGNGSSNGSSSHGSSSHGSSNHGRVAGLGVCVHQHVPPESLNQSWGAADRFTLVPRLPGQDVGSAADLLLSQWRDHLAGIGATRGPDTSASVVWPSMDVTGLQALLRHGLQPITVIAARTRPHGPTPPPRSAHGVTIRQAGPADEAAVTDLELRLIRYDGYFGGPVWRPATARLVREEIRGSLARPGPWTWLAERGGRPVGLIVVLPPAEAGWIAGMTSRSPAAYLQTMFVDAAERGTGIGSALVRQLHARLDDMGAEVTLLHHSQVNPLSAPFWYRMGYRPLWTSWEARPASALR